MSIGSVEDMSRRPPLGLPPGSIRAVLTLLVLAVVIRDLAIGGENKLPVFWLECLLISLAHYFSARRFIDLPRHVLAQLEASNVIPKENYPLFLPKGTIRLVILGSFVGLGFYLYQNGRLTVTDESSRIIMAVGCYLFGAFLGGLSRWWMGGKQSDSSRLWQDIRAFLVLLTMILTAGMYFALGSDQVNKDLQFVAITLTLFYFGSR